MKKLLTVLLALFMVLFLSGVIGNRTKFVEVPDLYKMPYQSAKDKLSDASHKLAEEVYKAAQQQQQAGAQGAQANAGQAQQEAPKGDDNVVDAEVVDDKK